MLGSIPAGRLEGQVMGLWAGCPGEARQSPRHPGAWMRGAGCRQPSTRAAAVTCGLPMNERRVGRPEPRPREEAGPSSRPPARAWRPRQQRGPSAGAPGEGLEATRRNRQEEKSIKSKPAERALTLRSRLQAPPPSSGRGRPRLLGGARGSPGPGAGRRRPDRSPCAPAPEAGPRRAGRRRRRRLGAGRTSDPDVQGNGEQGEGAMPGSEGAADLSGRAHAPPARPAR